MADAGEADAVEDTTPVEDAPEMEDVPEMEDAPEMEDVPELEDAPELEDVPPMPPEGGLTGRYHNSRNFENFVLERVDPGVEFDWNEAQPAPDVNRTNLTVRWTGQVKPRYTELYTFHTISDDGVRLWVDGRLVIDSWVNQGATERVGTISLESGQRYDIMLEYFQGSGGASVSLLWSSANQVREVIPPGGLEPVGEVFDQAPTVSLRVLDSTAMEGTPDTARVIVYRWGDVSQPLTVNLSYGGDVDLETDLDELPTSVELRENLSVRSLEIVTRNDQAREGAETLEVTLEDGPGYTLGAEVTASITVNDDEIPPPTPVFTITGTATWTGEPSDIVVAAYSDEALTEEVARRVLVEPGVYALSNLAAGTYHVAAYLDLNSNRVRDEDETLVQPVVDGAPFVVTLPPDALNVDIIFPPPPSNATLNTEGSCGCATPARPAPSGWPLLAALLLGAGLVARRRRS